MQRSEQKKFYQIFYNSVWVSKASLIKEIEI